MLFSVAALLLGAAILFLAGGINALLLPLRGTLEGMGAFWLGLLGAGWAVGYLAGCLRVPRLVARVGHVRAFGVMSALASLSILASLLFVHAPTWVALRAVAGFAFAGAAMIVESWLMERCDPTQRGRVFGVYTMIVLGAGTLGQLSLALGDPATATFFVVTAMLYSLSLIPTATSSSASPAPLLSVRLDVRGMWRNSPLALVGAVLIGVSNGSFIALAPVYADQAAFDVGAITLFVSLPVLAGALSQMPIGHLSDRLDRRHVLIGVVVLALALDIAFVTLPSASPSIAIGMAAVLGTALFAMYPVLVAHANDHARPEEAIGTSGTLLLFYSVGAIAGPAVAGALMSLTGPEGLFDTMLAAHLLLLGYTLWRLGRRDPVADELKEPFRRQAPTTTPQTLPLGLADDGAALADEGIELPPVQH